MWRADSETQPEMMKWGAGWCVCRSKPRVSLKDEGVWMLQPDLRQQAGRTAWWTQQAPSGQFLGYLHFYWDMKASPPWTSLQQHVCHLPLDVVHQSVEALLSLLWSQSGVTRQVPHDVKVRTHLVGQTCHTGILFISSNLTEQGRFFSRQKNKSSSWSQGRTDRFSPSLLDADKSVLLISGKI